MARPTTTSARVSLTVWSRRVVMAFAVKISHREKKVTRNAMMARKTLTSAMRLIAALLSVAMGTSISQRVKSAKMISASR